MKWQEISTTIPMTADDWRPDFVIHIEASSSDVDDEVRSHLDVTKDRIAKLVSDTKRYVKAVPKYADKAIKERNDIIEQYIAPLREKWINAMTKADAKAAKGKRK